MTKEYIMGMTRMQIHMYLEQLIDIKLREAGVDPDKENGNGSSEIREVNSGAELRAAMGL